MSRLTLRVLVKGASTVNWASGIDESREAFTFPRAIEAQLVADGWPAEVRAITLPSELTSKILLNWQQEVLGFSPDVVVLVYGHYETVHFVLPRWLERHANSMRARPRRLEELYRTRVLRPFWMMLARLQARLDTRLDPTLRRSRPRKVAADLEAYIRHVREIGRPLVYVFELLPPAERYRTWFPGMAERIGVMNDTIADLVRRLDDPEIRLFRVSELVDKYADGDLDVATPDGFHYTPYLHRQIGSALAREIEDWAAQSGHLDLA
jgi:hypothetical protein